MVYDNEKNGMTMGHVNPINNAEKNIARPLVTYHPQMAGRGGHFGQLNG